MTVSHKYRFIMVRCQKTASSSMVRAFRNYDPEIITRLTCRPEKLLGYRCAPPHIPGYEIPKLLTPEQSKEYFKFGFVRNPWDRMVSAWSYLIQGKRRQIKENAFIPWVLRDHKWFGLDFNMLDFMGPVDFIGRFESLQDDFNFVSSKVGLPHQVLPHKNKRKHKHYTEYYNPEAREKVRSRYSKDIEYFGYEFGA